MLLPNLFPQPQQVNIGAEKLQLTSDERVNCVLVLTEDASHRERTAAAVISSALAGITGNHPAIVYSEPPVGKIPIYIGEAARPALEGMSAPPNDRTYAGESYVLQVNDTSIALRGLSSADTLYAAHTLTQLFTVCDSNVIIPILTIRDWPDFRYRGLYMESKWGPDLMQLADWQELIDYMASLKYNLLTVGIYGCWNIQYDQQITEFLLTPIPAQPDLQTKKTITYYSARQGKWCSKTYLPPMFTEDFFGDVVAYGRRKNVIVRPHFNSLGHNTLIPRLYPEISACDENGWPTGYGLCLSNPAAWQSMAAIFTYIVQRYLLPNGVDHFHLGLDEVMNQKGVYRHHPQRVVNPWCQCSKCKARNPNEMIVDYALKLASHLKELGINHVGIWHDQLEQMGAMENEFSAQVKERGLQDTVIVEWWRYDDTPLASIRPELGHRRFVVPMTGYYFWSAYRNHVKNIEVMSQLGIQQSAEGVNAYGTYDKGFDTHYRYLAEWAWHGSANPDSEQWLDNYARYVYGAAAKEGKVALQQFAELSSGDNLKQILNLDGYRYSYVAVDLPYPRSYPGEPLAKLQQDPTASDRLAALADKATSVRQSLAKLMDGVVPQRHLAEQYLAEATRTQALVCIFRNLLIAAKTYEGICSQAGAKLTVEEMDQLKQCQQLMIEALAWHDQAVYQLELVKAHYLLPSMLRNFTQQRPFITQWLALFTKWVELPMGVS